MVRKSVNIYLKTQRLYNKIVQYMKLKKNNQVLDFVFTLLLVNSLIINRSSGLLSRGAVHHMFRNLNYYLISPTSLAFCYTIAECLIHLRPGRFISADRCSLLWKTKSIFIVRTAVFFCSSIETFIAWKTLNGLNLTQ